LPPILNASPDTAISLDAGVELTITARAIAR